METTQEPVPPAPSDYKETNSDQPEEGDAVANATTVPDKKPVSKKGIPNDKKKAAVQVLKFHNYFARNK